MAIVKVGGRVVAPGTPRFGPRGKDTGKVSGVFSDVPGTSGGPAQAQAKRGNTNKRIKKHSGNWHIANARGAIKDMEGD